MAELKSSACPRCDGCGRLATDDDETPWSFWEGLPPGSDLAVRLGLVKPKPCPACGGSGTKQAPADDPPAPPGDAPGERTEL